MLGQYSLVPRPSLAPVFDRLQYAKTVLQAIKNWSRGRPGNEARVNMLLTYIVSSQRYILNSCLKRKLVFPADLPLKGLAYLPPRCWLSGGKGS